MNKKESRGDLELFRERWIHCGTVYSSVSQTLKKKSHRPSQSMSIDIIRKLPGNIMRVHFLLTPQQISDVLFSVVLQCL